MTVAIERGTPGDTYNIGSDARITNLDLTRRILDIMDRDDASIDHVPDRPGHDRRYAVDSSKIRALGWMPGRSLQEGLVDTVQWYRANEAWWRPLRGAQQ